MPLVNVALQQARQLASSSLLAPPHPRSSPPHLVATALARLPRTSALLCARRPSIVLATCFSHFLLLPSHSFNAPFVTFALPASLRPCLCPGRSLSSLLYCHAVNDILQGGRRPDGRMGGPGCICQMDGWLQGSPDEVSKMLPDLPRSSVVGDHQANPPTTLFNSIRNLLATRTTPLPESVWRTAVEWRESDLLAEMVC